MEINPLFLEVWLRPAAGDPSSNTGIDVEGAHVRSVEVGGLGAILAENQPVKDFRFGLVEGRFADRWIRIAVEIEREAKQWSLAVDGELLIRGVPIDRHSFPGEVVFYGDENTTIYVDALQVSAETFPEFGGDSVRAEGYLTHKILRIAIFLWRKCFGFSITKSMD